MLRAIPETLDNVRPVASEVPPAPFDEDLRSAFLALGQDPTQLLIMSEVMAITQLTDIEQVMLVDAILKSRDSGAAFTVVNSLRLESPEDSARRIGLTQKEFSERCTVVLMLARHVLEHGFSPDPELEISAMEVGLRRDTISQIASSAGVAVLAWSDDPWQQPDCGAFQASATSARADDAA